MLGIAIIKIFKIAFKGLGGCLSFGRDNKKLPETKMAMIVKIIILIVNLLILLPFE